MVAGVATWLSIAGCTASRPPLELDRELRIRTFDSYWEALRDDFPYFDAVGIDWSQMRRVHRERAISAPDTHGFYKAMGAMFATLQDPHLVLKTYRAEHVRQSRGHDWIAPAVVEIGRRHYIWSWSDVGGCAGMDVGAYPQLMARGGEPWTRFSAANDLAFFESVQVPDSLEVQDASGEIMRLDPLPRVSPTGSRVERVVGVRDFRANFMEGTAFELAGTGAASVQVVLNDQRLYRSPLSQWPFNELQRRDRGSPSLGAEAPRPWWIGAMTCPGVGYLRISSFSGTAGDDRSSSRFDAMMSRDVRALMDSPCMIIDLRYNAGGNRRPVQHALGWFSSSPVRLQLSTWTVIEDAIRMPVVFKVDPVPFPYRGRVVVLVNRFSASAAEVFAQFMREHNGAIVVGERTTGAEAGVEVVYGPDGSSLSYGSIPFRYPGVSSFQTCGLVPDVQVPLTIERVREIGYGPAVLENEIDQMKAACRVLGLDAEAVLSGDR